MTANLRRVLTAFASGCMATFGMGLLVLYLLFSRFYDRLASGAISVSSTLILCVPPLLMLLVGAWFFAAAVRNADKPYSRRKLLGLALLIGPTLLMNLLPLAAILFGMVGGDLSVQAALWNPGTIVGLLLLLCMSAGCVLSVDTDLTRL